MKNKSSHTYIRRLWVMLCYLTILFITAQYAFYFTHFMTSELIDSLAASSIANIFWQPIVLLPILQFILLQWLAYFLLILFMGFVVIASGELFQLSEKLIYILGILCFLCALVVILILNSLYYPDSFFSNFFYTIPWLYAIRLPVLITASYLFFTMTLAAYIQLFLNHRHGVKGCIVMLLSVMILSIHLHDKLIIKKTRTFVHVAKPNIIFIGIDSLRPDFIGFFGSQEGQTKSIDQFLQGSMIFTNAYTPLARTFPTWISILTANYPKQHGARNNLSSPYKFFNQDNVAKRLQKAGYITIYATDEKRFSNLTESYGFDRIIGPKM